MSPAEVTFLVVLIAFLVGVYLTFRVIKECNDDEEDDIWS